MSSVKKYTYRFKYPPWDAAGGSNGSANAVEIIPAGATEPVLRRGKLARYPLRRGDVARLITAVGGGYGQRLERDPALVQDDVRNEFLTLSQVGEIYGVVMDPKTLAVDEAATRRLRQDMRKRIGAADRIGPA